MQQFDLKADRADVIVPALEIYIRIMTWTKASQIIVPHIGVSDGLVRDLYNEINGRK
jgi:exopolyphosphatase/guanosine-5'-triphosphate,3'-diphosphate pyrophosphatase